MAGTLYVALYLLSIGSVAALAISILSVAKRTGTKVGLGRVIRLSKDELRRLSTLDPVFLMHLSIAFGIGLSILVTLLDPFFFILPLVRDVLLVLTIPLVAGLAAAFVWRIQRYVQSKRIEGDLLRTSREFGAASTRIQLVLIVAITLTATELVLAWFPNIVVIDLALSVVRNGLVAFYYARPSVNLLLSFDRPPWAMRLPFKLSDVMAGTVDASQVKMGAGELSDFEGFERLSYDSCVEIGACESACPATAAGRPLSPRVLVRSLAQLERAKGGDADPSVAVSDDELWSCTTCGACVNACPVSVKHVDLIYDLRRNLVEGGKLGSERSTLLQNLTQSQNPYGLDPRSRGEWARENGVDTISTRPDAEYLYWVGCVSSFDQRAQSVARSLSKILKSAGLSFAILGDEEACTGDPARRLGEESRYQELAAQNVERMNGYGVKKIITTCPHCFNALKNEYPAFGGKYEVVHHTQLISDLIRQGKVELSRESVEGISVTLHDACYASRYNNIFEEPREILEATGTELREMRRTRDRTFCCGAGGSNYWYKVPQQRSIAGIRTEEAASTGAKAIATECPFCLSMFEDSTKVMGVPMKVRDVAEIVADEIREPVRG